MSVCTCRLRTRAGVTDAGEGSSGTAGKSHPFQLFFRLWRGRLPSPRMSGRLDTCPLFGAGDKNLGFSYKFFLKDKQGC